MRNTLTIGTLALALTGCNAVANKPDDNRSGLSANTRSVADLEKIVGDVYAPFSSGDATKMMANYAPDAVVIDAANNLPSQDRALITKRTADFAALKPTDLSYNPRIIQAINADTIVSSGITAFLADVAGHRQRVSVRYTHVLARQPDGRWLIVAEHNSIPPQPVSTGL
jgi:uncharacterized protein (TIGR02246 family)